MRCTRFYPFAETPHLSSETVTVYRPDIRLAAEGSRSTVGLGDLTTFEIDHQRASTAQAHFKEAGVERMVTLIEGDAHEQVAKLKAPIDVAFIDADKTGYVDYLN